jgi:signal transduction histidine kinase/FixJ family two-component response regulator
VAALRVLIVEDSAADAELVVLELRRAGFTPEVTRVDTREALANALDRGPWDVLIADHLLPGWSGLGALALMRERDIDVPFIIVSGTIGEETAVDAMKAGAHDYVLKENLRRLGPAVDRELREAQVRRERRQAVAALHELASRSAFLAQASRTLAASLDYEKTVAEASRIALPEVADWCLLVLAEERPRRLRAELRHQDATLEAEGRACLATHPLEGRHAGGLAPVLRTGVPGWLTLEDLVASVQGGGDEALVRRLGFASGLCVPLSSRGTTSGALILVRAAPERRFREDDLAFAQELASRLAMAFDSARLYRQAQEAVRARDEFLSVASHELNTPLATLTLQLDEAFAGDGAGAITVSPADRAAMIGRGRRQLSRLARLVDGLLDISRLIGKRLELERSSVDLGATARDVIDQLASEISRAGCTLQLQAEEGVVGNWDPLRVAQVITNLISNACKYGAGKPIEVKVEAAGRQARLSVTDHGIGISTGDMDRIFEIFERAVSARHYGGLGLGLYITRQVVEAHGGTIDVRSEQGKGSTFVVHLPFAAPAAERAGGLEAL